MLFLLPTVQDLLDPFPHLAADQRFVRAFVRHADSARGIEPGPLRRICAIRYGFVASDAARVGLNAGGWSTIEGGQATEIPPQSTGGANSCGNGGGFLCTPPRKMKSSNRLDMLARP